MAKFSSVLIEEVSGKLGSGLVMRQTAHGAVLAKAPRKASTPRRSEKQANTRCQMANLTANFRLYNGKLQQAFEGKKAGVSDANLYVAVNYGVNPVFITKQMRIAGACVLADCQFSQGSLPAIGYGVNAAGKLVSDLNLGALVIDENTTVAEFTEALIAGGDSWEEGDQLTCFVGTQWVGSDDMPRATMRAQKVILDSTDETPLWSVVSSQGFSTVGGYLGTSFVLDNMGVAWVHSRDKSGGGTNVSSQRLFVVSDILEDYQTYAALKASADSYGGINSKAVYLNPSSTLQTVGSLVVNPVTPSGGGSTEGGNSGGGSENGGSTTGSETGGGTEQGGNTGGGQQTVTVAAPTFYGETQFEETTEVTMSAESGAEIRYTTDGSTPTSASTLYSEPITLSDTTTVKAIAIKDGVSSTVTSRIYTKSADNGGGGDGEGSGDME